jgi:hypothetical protein
MSSVCRPTCVLKLPELTARHHVKFIIRAHSTLLQETMAIRVDDT